MVSWNKIKKGIITREEIFLIAFGMYLFTAFIDTTMFKSAFSYISIITKAIKYCSVVIVVIKICMDTYSSKKIFVFFGIFIVFLLSVFVSGYTNLGIIVLFIIGAKDVSLKKMVKIYFYLTLILLVITIISAKLGIIKNLTYYRGVFGETVSRQSLGIIYPTDLMAHVFFLVSSFLYLKQGSLKIYHYIIIFIIGYIFYKITNGRLDFISIVIMLVITILYNSKIIKLKFKYVRFCLFASFIICAIIMLVLTLGYNENNNFYVTIDNLLSSRLKLGNMMIEEYGISFFGQEINDHGYGGSETFEYDEYNYIDSSYIRILLKYGLLIIILLSIMNIWVNRKIYQKDEYLLLIIFTICVNSIVAQHYLEISYNFLLFMYFANIDERTKIYTAKIDEGEKFNEEKYN